MGGLSLLNFGHGPWWSEVVVGEERKICREAGRWGNEVLLKYAVTVICGRGATRSELEQQ